jgi:hypothetical protein
MGNQYRLHDMEPATIVKAEKDGYGLEFANCLNSFGDQSENAAFIVRALNSHEELVEALISARDVWVPSDSGVARLIDDALKLAGEA